VTTVDNKALKRTEKAAAVLSPLAKYDEKSKSLSQSTLCSIAESV